MNTGQLLKQIYNRINSENEDIIKVLSNIGVLIYEPNFKIKDTYIILNEIAQKWNDLKDEGSKYSVRNEYIATTIAGVRYRNEFILLMEEWR